MFKKIKVLSGGEKSRVALAKTLLSQANFLLLDEPTNHLDIQSVNILIQALQQYTGTYLIVSHDRHFISQTANKIWYVEDQVVKEYPGNYTEFNRWYTERQQELEAKKTDKKQGKKDAPKKQKKQITPTEQSRLKKELNTAQKKLQQVEKEIMELEAKIKASEDEMAKPSIYGDPYKLAEVNETYEKQKQRLAHKNTEWEDLAGEVDRLEGEMGA